MTYDASGASPDEFAALVAERYANVVRCRNSTGLTEPLDLDRVDCAGPTSWWMQAQQRRNELDDQLEVLDGAA